MSLAGMPAFVLRVIQALLQFVCMFSYFFDLSLSLFLLSCFPFPYLRTAYHLFASFLIIRELCYNCLTCILAFWIAGILAPCLLVVLLLYCKTAWNFLLALLSSFSLVSYICLLFCISLLALLLPYLQALAQFSRGLTLPVACVAICLLVACLISCIVTRYF